MERPVVDPKRTNLPAVPVKFHRDEDGLVDSYAAPGEFELEYLGPLKPLILACPGCGQVSRMMVGNPKPVDSPSWLIEGTLEKPTLKPSIRCSGCCGWHGYLTDGVFTTADN